ncbi:MAG: DEAD/DEAH box helicase [Deltaproteobacteria bacterium]|nr:DEAD/DEAH box helicase [Deltaproteobacteria bacterium]
MKEIQSFIELNFQDNITSRTTLDKQEGEYAEFPPDLHGELVCALKKQGINRLYSHQRDSFNSISDNKDTLLVSRTASGKTLSFFLPVFNEYLNAEAPFSVLLLYPTKALSRDQESTFGNLMAAAGRSGRVGTFDGDTPRDERLRIQRSADFVITNPDMLHGGVLPNHNRRWKTFLSRLRYIIVDEVHTYRGSFGSHVSNVFRRLARVCEIHGSKPVFVCSSATVGNPAEHTQALFHRDFTIIQRDGSPQPVRDLYFVNPSLVRSHGDTLYRKGPASVSIPLLREAAKRNIRTICFCRSRQEVERLYRAVIDKRADLKEIVKPYRGGLLPNERRQLERDLLEGKIKAIITTNALELGIDIGDLDLCILSGHPGTVASFWQQSGRVGRKERKSTVVYIAKDTPIDQYIVNHPEFISSAPVEQAWLNADNPYILLQHLPCMAHEHPLRESEHDFDSMVFSEAVALLKENKTIVPYHDTFRYALQEYPAKGVNLRGMTDYNVDIYCGTEVIGELDPIGARGTLYKDAIYQHLGTRYMSMELDLEKKLCRVEPVNVDYYTEAHWEGMVTMTEPEEEREVQGASLVYGFINVNKQPKLYKKIRERSYENIGYGPITLPPFEYETTGVSLRPPKSWIRTVGDKDKRYIGAALFGLSYLLKHTAPSLCMADVKDVDTDVSLKEVESDQWKSALFMYDAIEGGVGYSEKIYEQIETCLTLCRDILNECGCNAGCPSCVPPLPPSINSEELESLLVESNAATACTESLLTVLLDGKVVVPDVKVDTTHVPVTICQAEEDSERKVTKVKLVRASRILEKKRDRVY